VHRRLASIVALALASTILAGVNAPLGAQVAEPSTIQAVYAVPSDVVPVSGRLAASAESIAVVQDWFAGQASGNYPVFNETSGVVDVELLILNKTKAEVEALSRNDLSVLLTAKSAVLPSVANSEIFVYLEASQGTGNVCGYSGSIVVIIMHNCGTYPSSTATFPYGDTYLVAHELTHLLGAVASCAPNYLSGGHLDGDNRDVLFMGPGGRAWDDLRLDPGNDDYYNHGRNDCPDIADSPVFGTWATNGPSGPPPESASAICDGLEATIVGTSGNDWLAGTPGIDIIAGLQGNDTIHGLGGDDIICAGKGDDVVYGGVGFDIIYGAQGNDTMYAANGTSTQTRADERGARMFGGAGADSIYGTNRWDRMQGGAGADRLYGYEGRDWMRGGAESDVVTGAGNIDDLHGGNGNDRIIVEGADTVRGGAGAKDVCVIPSGTTPTLLRSCELT